MNDNDDDEDNGNKSIVDRFLNFLHQNFSPSEIRLILQNNQLLQSVLILIFKSEKKNLNFKV